MKDKMFEQAKDFEKFLKWKGYDGIFKYDRLPLSPFPLMLMNIQKSRGWHGPVTLETTSNGLLDSLIYSSFSFNVDYKKNSGFQVVDMLSKKYLKGDCFEHYFLTFTDNDQLPRCSKANERIFVKDGLLSQRDIVKNLPEIIEILNEKGFDAKSFYSHWNHTAGLLDRVKHEVTLGNSGSYPIILKFLVSYDSVSNAQTKVEIELDISSNGKFFIPEMNVYVKDIDGRKLDNQNRKIYNLNDLPSQKELSKLMQTGKKNVKSNIKRRLGL